MLETAIQDTIRLLADSIAYNTPNIEKINNSWLDNLYKLSMIFIALCNFIFGLYIFFSKNSKEDTDKEAIRKLGLLKTLVLDHKLSILYNNFSEITKETKVLLSDISDQERSTLDEKLAEIFINLRLEFVMILSAIDSSLYKNTLAHLDTLQEQLTTAIFDTNLDLTSNIDSKYNNCIQEPINNIQILIINELFKYKGK